MAWPGNGTVASEEAARGGKRTPRIHCAFARGRTKRMHHPHWRAVQPRPKYRFLFSRSTATTTDTGDVLLVRAQGPFPAPHSPWQQGLYD